MNTLRQTIQRPLLGKPLAQHPRSEACLILDRGKRPVTRQTRQHTRPGPPLTRGVQGRDDDIEDREQQSLKTVEPLRQRPVHAEDREFVQPRHQQPGFCLAEADHAGRVGRVIVEESLCVETVSERGGILPEDLIDQIVVVHIDGRHRDPRLRFHTEQRERRDQNGVAEIQVAMPEPAKQDRST